MDKGKNEITKIIVVSGIVQGVGFRPLVYHIANKYKIKGTVRNKGGVVEITATSFEKNIKYFVYDLKIYPYGNHEITSINIFDSDFLHFDDFKIIKSEEDDHISIIPPDLPVCEECQNEMNDEKDRRFSNPFISCMACGPRYTIVEELPYDRKNTTMEEYVMCPSCKQDYENPEDRRFHAQTISCNECGPYLLFQENNSNNNVDNIKCDENHEEINAKNIKKTVDIIKNGGIIAIKGIGGYHFACSPFMEESVNHLRELKSREEKPFAVMFASTDHIKEYCYVSQEEKELLESKVRPIVLLYKKNNQMAYATDKGSINCGAFLPYTPLQILLIKECGPLIMTSANLANKPIIKEDNLMLSVSSPYLNGVLYNERKIVRSVDDSVAKIVDDKPQVIRRSRGYVPYPVTVSNNIEETQIFAAGGDLKSAFCMCSKNHAVVSQYFGDLEENAILQEYKNAYNDLSRLLKFSPELVVCDLHPNYFSSRFARSLGINLLQVQHHHAHVASVMAEHDLKGKVIGVAFDGTGYGTDGNIWGGEFLVCENAKFERVAHLAYTPIMGGDSSMKDAKKTATCFLLNAGLEDKIIDDRIEIIKAAIHNKINTVYSSSMGRLFDAVASILGIGDKNNYEGQCAINLEKEAVLAKKNKKEIKELKFELQEQQEMLHINPNPVLESLVNDRAIMDKDSLALSFHYAVVDMIVEVCNWIRKLQGIDTVALSGGVFQNTLLIEETIYRLRQEGFHVFVNRIVPPNDGAISLGQTFIGLADNQN